MHKDICGTGHRSSPARSGMPLLDRYRRANTPIAESACTRDLRVVSNPHPFVALSTPLSAYHPAMRAMVVKEFRELGRDRRTFAMLIAMPLLLLIVFGYAANFYVSSVDTAVVGPQAEQAAAQLPDYFDTTVVEPADSRADAEKLLQDNEVDVAIVTGATPVVALVNGANLFAAQSTVSVLNKAGAAVQVEVLYNPELKTSWVMVPAIIGLILTFIGTIITSIGLVREREAGTLEQLAVMPIKPSQVILGKITPYFLLAALDMTIVTVLAMVLFGVPFVGNPLVFALGAGCSCSSCSASAYSSRRSRRPPGRPSRPRSSSSSPKSCCRA